MYSCQEVYPFIYSRHQAAENKTQRRINMQNLFYLLQCVYQFHIVFKTVILLVVVSLICKCVDCSNLDTHSLPASLQSRGIINTPCRKMGDSDFTFL